MAVQRSIQSLTVISPAPGSVHVPARTFASWSRPQPSAACLVSKPDWLAPPAYLADEIFRIIVIW
jgi:hypothetical protein